MKARPAQAHAMAEAPALPDPEADTALRLTHMPPDSWVLTGPGWWQMCYGDEDLFRLLRLRLPAIRQQAVCR